MGFGGRGAAGVVRQRRGLVVQVRRGGAAAWARAAAGRRWRGLVVEVRRRRGGGAVVKLGETTLLDNCQCSTQAVRERTSAPI